REMQGAVRTENGPRLKVHIDRELAVGELAAKGVERTWGHRLAASIFGMENAILRQPGRRDNPKRALLDQRRGGRKSRTSARPLLLRAQHDTPRDDPADRRLPACRRWRGFVRPGLGGDRPFLYSLI